MGSNENFSSLERVAVFRALGGLGDFLCSVPALRSLRAALPKTEIVLVGLPTAQPLVDRFSHYLDGLLEFPGCPGLPEQRPRLLELPGFLAEAQAQHFDLAIQMHGSGVLTNPLTVLVGAKHSAGFFLPDHYCPDPERFLPYLSQESEVRRYLRLLEFLGISTQGEALEFPLHEVDRQAGSALQSTYALYPNRYFCIHPGASVIDRCWRPEYFAAVADAVAQRGFQVVLTGSAVELPLTRSVARLMQADSINLAGCTDLGALAALLQGARSLVCNDTGVSHLADALQVPSVVVFTGSDLDRWAPLNRLLHRVVGEGATPADVMAEVDALLQFPTERDLSLRAEAVRL